MNVKLFFHINEAKAELMFLTKINTNTESNLFEVMVLII